jgi:hypothetical protein
MNAPISAFVDTAPETAPSGPYIASMRPPSGVRSAAPRASGKLPRPRIYNPFVEAIVPPIAAHYGVNAEDVLSHSQSKILKTARAMAMHVARMRYQYSSLELGRFFGRDSSSVLNALKVADRVLAENHRGIAEVVRCLVEAESVIVGGHP